MRGAVVCIMSAWVTAEMGIFAMTKGDSNETEIFTTEANEYAAMKTINSYYLWIFAMVSEPM